MYIVVWLYILLGGKKNQPFGIIIRCEIKSDIKSLGLTDSWVVHLRLCLRLSGSSSGLCVTLKKEFKKKTHVKFCVTKGKKSEWKKERKKKKCVRWGCGIELSEVLRTTTKKRIRKKKKKKLRRKENPMITTLSSYALHE